MAISVAYAVPTTSAVYDVNVSNFIPRSVLIENHSGDSVIFDNTVDALLVIPPGVSAPINIHHLVYTVRLRTLTNTTGYVSLTVSDSERDTNNAPTLQQLPGGTSITGTITLAPGTTVGLTPGSTVGMVPGSTIGLTAGNTVGLIPGTGITVNNDVTDPVARSYLAALQGLLPQSMTAFTFDGVTWQEQSKTLINAVTAFAVSVMPTAYPDSNTNTPDGLLWVWVELSGSRIYVEDGSYWVSGRNQRQTALRPIWLPYREYVPAGGKIGIGYEGAGTVVLRA